MAPIPWPEVRLERFCELLEAETSLPHELAALRVATGARYVDRPDGNHDPASITFVRSMLEGWSDLELAFGLRLPSAPALLADLIHSAR